MKITKLLALNAKPAPALVARAKKISLKYAERVNLPPVFATADGALENALGETRPLEVGDVLLDEKGSFYVVEAEQEHLMKVTGDAQMLQEAAWALTARGVRLAQTSDGFAMVENDQFRSMLASVGLQVEAFEAPFVPIPLPQVEEEDHCCCCGHHHEHGEECCCGHHHDHDEGGCCGHHDHDHGKECGCGHHHHEHREECGCDHHHDHGEGGCCGHHDHDHGKECGCGHHHHEHREECGCDHHHEHGEGCCCGHHDHDHGKECGCGHHHHEHREECGCGHHH